MKHPKILHEDEDIIVVVKPCGMSSEGDSGLEQDVVGFLKTHIYEESDGEEADPYVAAVHRLDKPVGGVMVFVAVEFGRGLGGLGQFVLPKFRQLMECVEQFFGVLYE